MIASTTELIIPNEKQLFLLGQIVATPGALAAFGKTGQTPIAFLDRHCCGDWGDLSISDRQANDHAIKDGSRVMSSYKLIDGTVVWMITNAIGDDGHREATTVILPREY